MATKSSLLAILFLAVLFPGSFACCRLRVYGLCLLEAEQSVLVRRSSDPSFVADKKDGPGMGSLSPLLRLETFLRAAGIASEDPKFNQGVFLICEADHGSLQVKLLQSDDAHEVVKVSTSRQCKQTPVLGSTGSTKPVLNHADIWTAIRVRFVDLREYMESLIVCPKNGVVSVVKERKGGRTKTLARCRPGMEAHVVTFNMTKCPSVAA